MIRALCLAALIVIAIFANKLHAQSTFPTEPPAAQSEPQELRIGVRKAARPFSYRAFTPRPNGETDHAFAPGTGPIGAEGYDGYMVYICDEVLKEMLIPRAGMNGLHDFKVKVIDVDDMVIARREADDTTPFDRLDFLQTEIDILCDPATINAERAKRFAMSPPLFVTGVGYLKLKGERPPDRACRKNKALIGFVGATNAAQRGILTILNAGEWRNFRDTITAALRDGDNGTENCPAPAGVGGQGGIFWAGNTHDEVAKKFCDEEITYYVGDLEIIAEHARRHAGCQWSSGARSFTSDRYAIFANVPYSTPEKAMLIGRFFEILNREIAGPASLLDRAFFATFGEAKRSQKLDIFFWSMRGTP